MPYLGGNLREEPKSEGMLHTQYGTIFQQEAISHIAHPNKSFCISLTVTNIRIGWSANFPKLLSVFLRTTSKKIQRMS